MNTKFKIAAIVILFAMACSASMASSGGTDHHGGHYQKIYHPHNSGSQVRQQRLWGNTVAQHQANWDDWLFQKTEGQLGRAKGQLTGSPFDSKRVYGRHPAIASYNARRAKMAKAAKDIADQLRLTLAEPVERKPVERKPVEVVKPVEVAKPVEREDEEDLFIVMWLASIIVFSIGVTAYIIKNFGRCK
jgi:hypothetical protein